MSLATLQSAAPEHHSSIAAAADPALECPSCSSRMAPTPNPYYGSGLAEHRMIALCTGCHHIAFIPEPVEPPVERISSRIRSLFSRR